MDQSGKQPDNSLDGSQDSLETPTNVGESLESGSAQQTPSSGTSGSGSTPPPIKKNNIFRVIWERLNVYLLLFILVVIIAIVVVVVAVIKNDKGTSLTNNSTSSNTPAQTLSTKTLQQLANNSVTVGGANQLLNIESDTVFEGGVLIRGNLQVAGTITAGGSLSLPGISVSGESTFGQVQAKTLAITGNAAIQGQLTVQSGLSVNGNGTFSGTITANTIAASSIQINGPLVLLHHIEAGGGVPGRSNGSALGGGGSSSVSGSDTAGSISIHTGDSPGAGCFITVDFTQSFSSTPHVIVTPVGSAAAGLQYYINRSTTNFSVCTANAASADQSFGFDYIIFD